MIQVTTEEKQAKEIPEYPKLMKSDFGSIVLFSSESIGTIICDSKVSGEIGFYSKYWDMSKFTDYNEPVTIQNV